MKTDKELKDLAVDLYEGRIFTDRFHLNNPREIGIVFMPIGLGGFGKKTKEEIADIAMVYEYLDQAGPTSINGHPIFGSCWFLNRKEFDVLWKYYEKYRDMKKEFESD